MQVKAIHEEKLNYIKKLYASHRFLSFIKIIERTQVFWGFNV